MAENVPETALFVCFGAMSNVGAMTGLAALADFNQEDMLPAIAAIVNAINEN